MTQEQKIIRAKVGLLELARGSLELVDTFAKLRRERKGVE